MAATVREEFHQAINEIIEMYNTWSTVRQQTYNTLREIQRKVHEFQDSMDITDIFGIVIDIFAGVASLSAVVLGPEMLLAAAVLEAGKAGIDVTASLEKFGFDADEANEIQETLDRDTETTKRLIKMIKHIHVNYPSLPETDGTLLKDAIDVYNNIKSFAESIVTLIEELERDAAEEIGAEVPIVAVFTLVFDVSKLVNMAIESDEDKKGVLEKRIDKIIEILERNTALLWKARKAINKVSKEEL